MSNSKEFLDLVEFARKFHGHVGPFLVIGLKMGLAVRRALKVSDAELTLLKANVQVPLHPPFSCLLDGIQVATTCTVGNQRLQIMDADLIEATFTIKGRSRTMTLNPTLAEQLRHRLTQDQLTENYAQEIGLMPEDALFRVIAK